MSFNPESFSEITENLNRNTKSKLFIFDSNNEVANIDNSGIDMGLLARAKAILEYNGAFTENGLINYIEFDDHLYFTSLIGEFNWKVVGIVPMIEITKNNRNILIVTAMSFFNEFFCNSFYLVVDFSWDSETCQAIDYGNQIDSRRGFRYKGQLYK